MKYTCMIIGCCLLLLGCREKSSSSLSPEEALGKRLFFNVAFSNPAGQSCATCHRPERGFADTLGRPVSEGAVRGAFSMRNAITIAYSAYVPPLSYDAEEETWVGGLFWDGRANTLEEQILSPLMDRMEMAATKEMLVQLAKQSDDYRELQRLYRCADHVDSIYAAVTLALAAYERSREVCPFSSKFDAYLAGKCRLTEEELRGMDLFQNKGLCANCHVMEVDERAGHVLFTDHTYDNLGIPVNPRSDFYNSPYGPNGRDTLDRGLGGFLGDTLQYGKFRVPTLRNIARTAPYGHNGYFTTLEDIVHFYNVRDVSDEYPAAEYPATVNREELGDLKLTSDEEAAIVAFMETLTDGWESEE